MAKRKQNKRKPKRKYQPPSRKLLRSIDEAQMLIDEREYGQAYAKLVTLLNRNPRSKLILEPLVEVCEAVKNWHNYIKYGERLAALEKGEDQAVTLNNLIVAYTDLACPGLVWTTAERLLKNHADFEYIARITATMAETKSFVLDDERRNRPPFDTVPFEGDEFMRFIARHDRVRLYSEESEYEKTIEAGKALLMECPSFAPVLNNIATANFMLGNYAQAIETARRVLQDNSQDVHAQANLVRFLFLSGQFEESADSMQTFRNFTVDHGDLRIKQAECYAYLGDDQGVLDIFALAQKEEMGDHPFMLHFAATANMRVGKESLAWELWQRALELNPEFTIAEQNLADRYESIDERDAPFYFPFPYWVSADLPNRILKALDGKSARRAMNSFLTKNPHILSLAPHLLDRSDDSARRFVLAIYNDSRSSSLAEALYQFGTGRWGNYQIRMDALRGVSEHHPDLIPDSRAIKMYVDGEQTEVMFLNHHIYWEPKEPEALNKKALNLHNKAYILLQDGNYAEAESLLHEVIAAEPNFPSAYNHLALVYQMQDRQDEAFAVTDIIDEKFPDYFFGRITKANRLTEANETEQATTILNELFQIEELHISEYRALAQAQIKLALKKNERDAAKVWLNMWEQLDEDNPKILPYKMQVEGPQNFMQQLRTLLE